MEKINNLIHTFCNIHCCVANNSDSYFLQFFPKWWRSTFSPYMIVFVLKVCWG